MHASAAVVKRHHPDYSSTTLCLRAFIHCLRYTSKLSESPSNHSFRFASTSLARGGACYRAQPSEETSYIAQ
eukprot:5135521-Amphidinium_carterae.1